MAKNATFLGAGSLYTRELERTVKLVLANEIQLNDLCIGQVDVPLRMLAAMCQRSNTYFLSVTAAADPTAAASVRVPSLTAVLDDFLNGQDHVHRLPASLQKPEPPPAPAPAPAAAPALPPIQVVLPDSLAAPQPKPRQPQADRQSEIVRRRDKSGKDVGADDKLKDLLKGASVNRTVREDETHKDYWPMRGDKKICITYIKDCACYRRCGGVHLDQGDATPVEYKQVQECCTKLAALN